MDNTDMERRLQGYIINLGSNRVLELVEAALRLEAGARESLGLDPAQAQAQARQDARWAEALFPSERGKQPTETERLRVEVDNLRLQGDLLRAQVELLREQGEGERLRNQEVRTRMGLSFGPSLRPPVDGVATR